MLCECAFSKRLKYIPLQINIVDSMSSFSKLLRSLWRIPYVHHPLIALGVVLILIVTAFYSLRLFTRHGDEFAVPDFCALPLAQVYKLAEEYKLNIVLLDSSYVVTKRPGTVLHQQPEAGEKVKRGRHVFLSINACQPMLVSAPNLVGETLRQALILLEQSGLQCGQLSFTPDIALNSVLQQSYDGQELVAGEKIPKGELVDLLLGQGFESSMTTQPNVIQLTLQEARRVLASRSLNIGKVVFDETVKDIADSLAARVYTTNPQYLGNRELPLGSRVNLWLTLNASRIAAQAIQEESNNHIQDSLDIKNEEEEIDNDFVLF
jgi:hypothetical protein